MTPRKLNRILWGVLLVLILGVAGGLFIADKHMTRIAKETADLRAKAEVNKQRLVVYEMNRQQVESLSYVDDLAAQVLPADQNQSAVIAEVSQFALRSNLSVASISFDEVPEDSKNDKKDKKNQPELRGVKVVPATLELKEGSRYDDVLKLLQTIENNRRRMQITNISLTPSEEDGDILTQVTLKLNLYTKADEKSDKEAADAQE